MKALTLILASSAAAVAFMSSEIVETILIKGKDGPVRINKTDFDADEHTEYKGKEENVQSEPPQVQTSEPVVKLEDSDDNATRVALAQQPDPTIPGNTDAVQQQEALKAVQAPEQRLVTKVGSKWFVTDTNEKPIEADGIDSKGYKTEAEGWKAAYPSVA